MVDNISKGDWQRLDESRESEGLTTQSEIQDWLKGSPSNLAKALALPFELIKEILSAKDIDEMPSRSNIRKVRVRRDEVEEEFDEKEDKLRQERIEDLEKRGKLVTSFREQMKKSDTVDEVLDILDDAFDELGDGKNYNMLVENSRDRINQIESGE